MTSNLKSQFLTLVFEYLSKLEKEGGCGLPILILYADGSGRIENTCTGYVYITFLDLMSGLQMIKLQL